MFQGFSCLGYVSDGFRACSYSGRCHPRAIEKEKAKEWYPDHEPSSRIDNRTISICNYFSWDFILSIIGIRSN